MPSRRTSRRASRRASRKQRGGFFDWLFGSSTTPVNSFDKKENAIAQGVQDAAAAVVQGAQNLV